MKVLALSSILFVTLLAGVMAEEYTGRYLYRQGDADDTGAILLTLAEGSPRPTIAVAVGQRSGEPYLGVVRADGSIAFKNLPVDKYDLMVVTEDTFHEGFTMIQNSQPEVPEGDREALAQEIAKIEGFFDGKTIHRTAWSGERACVLLQQWRIGQAVKQSGEAVKGTIHSIDLIWFEKPLKGWQLVKRRQVYREELARKEPLEHLHVGALGDIRVVKSEKSVGPVPLK